MPEEENAMAAHAPARNTPLAITAALTILGIVLAVAGVLYVTQTAAHLPSLLPGHQAGSAHHHIKHALAAFGLALLAWIGAWLTTGKRTRGAT
jgi:hypothetical protein